MRDNENPPSGQDGGWVYFIAASEVDLVKIGTSCSPPIDRLRQLQTGSPVLLDLISYIQGGRSLEQRLHKAFSGLREHGEWFRMEGRLATLVFSVSADTDPTAELVRAGVYG